MQLLDIESARALLRIGPDDLCVLQNKFGLSHGLRINMAYVPRGNGIALLNDRDCASWLKNLFPRGLPLFKGAVATAEQLTQVASDRFDTDLCADFKVLCAGHNNQHLAA